MNLLFADESKLSVKNSMIFRSWFIRIVEEQLRQGPSPKWVQRDCVGLVRYAVNESAKEKDLAWMKSHGFSTTPVPPNMEVNSKQRERLQTWVQYDNTTEGAYVSAIGLIQNNSVFVSKNLNEAQPGDLLFYDHLDSQHLMIWMGKYIAYHTGTVTEKDNGLRRVSLSDLTAWKDSRWRPNLSNPNFIGIFRFAFLSK